jgi:hypothetical protein
VSGALRNSLAELPVELYEELIGNMAQRAYGNPWSWVELAPASPSAAVLPEASLLCMRHSDKPNLRILLLDDATVVWCGLSDGIREIFRFLA